MKVKKVYYKASDFKYPTSEERKSSKDSFPDLKNFGFEYQSEIEIMMGSINEWKTFNKKTHLYWWDLCLLNKIGKLYKAYLNSYSNFHRGIPHEGDKEFDQKYINKLQFDFYSETFYYYLFSVRDMVLQILNVFYDLDLEENKVNINELKAKITNVQIHQLIERFSRDLKTSKEIRDSFTHRFPIDQSDYRTSYSEKENSIGLSAGYAKTMEPELIMEDINKASFALADIINKLREEMKYK